jgi:hypothetical protein
MNTNFLNWYSGKSAEKLQALMPGFLTSVEQGYWEPGLSRSFRSALTKHNVATKAVRPLRREMERLGTPAGASEYDEQYRRVARMGWDAATVMIYGPALTQMAGLDLDAMDAAASDKLKPLMAQVRRYVADFTPVMEAVRRLDATRPAPVFTSLGISPTVTATLGAAWLNLNLATIRPCPYHIEVRESTDSKGKAVFEAVMVLDFPANTVHDASRFASAQHCHACGHRISNCFNWVCILANDDNGQTYSMWVGRDCAKSIFGIDVKGECEYKGIPFPGRRWL